ncbi:MAG: class I SAM-dependent methyltransferase [Christensenellales bacterium]|jgi:hypothetical protein
MREFSSFRDPSGQVFFENGRVLRQVNNAYRAQYDALMDRLYPALVKEGLLIPHAEEDMPLPEGAYKILAPEKVPFISYPYEWSFGQLRDAALVTLKCHRMALDQNMILKDASAYNIQFVRGKAVLIDTLSFELYEEGKPWIAYGQFCRHFLAPLLLMAHVDVRLSQLLRNYIDGIPLDLASTLLGRKGGFTATQHIRWHARAIAKHGQDGKSTAAPRELRLGKLQHVAMIDSLIRAVSSIRQKGIVTEWGDYYAHTNYTDEAASEKERLVSAFLDEIQPKTAWDFGANDGRYTRLSLKYGGSAVAFDIDPVAVERSYNAVKASGEEMLPLLLDLTNPTPAIGFANRERGDIASRQKPDCIMMLAVIHHMAISNNLPFEKIAEWLASMAKHVIIEFVPKADSQVQTLLATRDDIFPDYHEQGFEKAFGTYFTIRKGEPIQGTKRTLYLMTAK